VDKKNVDKKNVERKNSGFMGLYIHIPFCKQLCSYCDFHFSVSLMRTREMLNCLMREMEMKAENNSLPEKGFDTLYFGGGTPTVYGADEIKQLSDKALSLFFPKFPEEWTVEANPDDLATDYLARLADMGVNRLSIGLQSFIDRDLQIMNRRHSAGQGIKSVENAQKAGFNNIGIDLIYGFPGMSLEEWKYNLECAVNLGVQHISAYHLSIENKTILGKRAEKGAFSPIDDELSDLQYKLLEEKLLRAGYVHYEISNFALPAFMSRHNSAYWEKQAYTGIGPSAHSYDGYLTRKNNIANNIKYIESIQQGVIPEETEILSDKDYYNESILTSLRTQKGLNLNSIPEPFGNRFQEQANKHLSAGTMIYDGSYKIPSKYFLISDSIILDFIVI
jgi:oxygen-independent coproporphyrinogen-3 oxidase